MAEIKTCLQVGWKLFYTPLHINEQWNKQIHQRFQELEQADHESQFLRIKQRLEPLFQTTKEQIELLQKRIDELQRRLSKFESYFVEQRLSTKF